ncbi:alpha/beta fold hydrolase [Dactylosporangium salmoneum]|uniref:3-oxoadipate enol-lactonase n=1 Tax=Dactylosporangium salmoneum TaxID=53361 RepID=A0ABN3G665_9ACTN
MSVPALRTVHLAGSPDRPLLVVGPSLGTRVERLWGEVATLLAEDFHVVGWELPGHGGAPLGERFTIAELARGVRAAADRVLSRRSAPDGRFAYAGDSVGGAVGLQLVLDHADRVDRAALVATGARIGDAGLWRDRAALVRGSGTTALLAAAAQRWWAPGFAERAPDIATALLDDLSAVDAEGYAQVCDALRDFDVRDRLREVRRPLLAIAGAADRTTPVASLREIAGGAPGARLVELDGIAHLPPVEAPRAIASLVRDFLAGAGARHVAGMANRRAVLGDAHVDRAIAAGSSLTADFQDLITRYAWGEIWDRPGLSRRDRSIAVLTALVAGRHFDELEFHLRAALRNGLSRDEIIEVLLQTAIYVGVPAANTAFGVAARVLDTRDPA